jgi:hypothetical protein
MSYPVTIAGLQPSAVWTTSNPTLDQFELGVESDTGKAKIGDGVTAWTSLPYLDFAHGSNVKRYEANVSQATTAAPASTILENTLGGTPAWGRTSAGLYTLTLTGVWTANTSVLFGAGKTGTPTTGGQIPAWARTSADVLTFYGFDVAGAAADWLTSAMSILITVHP